MKQWKDLILALETDAALNEEFYILLKDGKIAEIVDAAARKGFTITETELREYLGDGGTKTEKNPSEVLTEEALESVAGGTNYTVSKSCWFLGGSGDPNRCTRWICYKTVQLQVLKFETQQCYCYGTSRCVDKMHHKVHACR